MVRIQGKVHIDHVSGVILMLYMRLSGHTHTYNDTVQTTHGIVTPVKDNDLATMLVSVVVTSHHTHGKVTCTPLCRIPIPLPLCGR